MRNKRYVSVIKGWNGGSETTFYFASDGDFTTKVTDTPSNTLIPGKIVDAGLIQWDMFSSGGTYGASKFAFGEVVLDNLDNSLDYLYSYGFDGRTIEMYEGDLGAAFPYGFTKLYTATIGYINPEWHTISFVIRDAQIKMDIPVPSGIFSGDNVRPNGVNGESDLLGKYKPMVLGRIRNMKPILCNASKLIYAVSPINGISVQYMGSDFRVYDRGVPMVYGGTYINQADMENVPPYPGQYKVWETGGYIRLGSSVSDLTCDVVSYGRSSTARPGNLIRDLLTICSIPFNTSSMDTLINSFSEECGVYICGDTIASVMDKLCSACGGYWFPDQYGVIQVGRVLDPTTLSAAFALSTSINVYSVKPTKNKDTASGVPAHTFTLLRSRNPTVQTDLAGIVAASRKTWLAEEWRKTQVVNASIKSAHPLSEELTIETCLSNAATAECTRRADLYMADRYTFELTTDLDVFGSAANIVPGMCIVVDLEDIINQVTTHRYNIVDKKMMLIGYTQDRTSNRATLKLWG